MVARTGARGRSAVPSNIALRLPDGTLVSVHPFPATESFAGDIRDAWSGVAREATDADGAMAALEAALRKWYPRAMVRDQDPMAALTMSDRVWYVFRDGQVRHADSRGDALYAALQRARQTTSRAEVALEGANAALEAAGTSRPLRRPASTGRS